MDSQPGTRFRLVTRHTSGEEHVSSVVLSEEEACELLALEAQLHRATGWTVTTGPEVLVCRRGAFLRTVEIRRYAPLADIPVP